MEWGLWLWPNIMVLGCSTPIFWYELSITSFSGEHKKNVQKISHWEDSNGVCFGVWWRLLAKLCPDFTSFQKIMGIFWGLCWFCIGIPKKSTFWGGDLQKIPTTYNHFLIDVLCEKIIGRRMEDIPVDFRKSRRSYACFPLNSGNAVMLFSHDHIMFLYTCRLTYHFL